jgi:hypothetical protein
LNDGPSLLIGTGRLGKSSSLADRDDVRLVTSLASLHDLCENGAIRDDEYLVIDSLYRVAVELEQSTRAAHEETFQRILDSGRTEDGTPIGAVLRPWSYQYLRSSSESAVGSAIAEWDRHYATVSKSDTVEIGSELTELSPDAVENYCDEIHFKYDIDTEGVTRTYETYVPHLLLDLTRDTDEYLPPGVLGSKSGDATQRLRDTLSEFGQDLFKATSFRSIQSSAKQLFTRFKQMDQSSVYELVDDIDRDSLPDDVAEYLSEVDTQEIAGPLMKTAGNVVPGAYPVLLFLLYYTKQEDERVATFEQFQQQSGLLFGDATPSPTQELVESQLGLEPYTLESAGKLASQETVVKLRTLQTGLERTRDVQRALSGEVSDVVTAFAELEERFAEFDTDLSELRRQFEALEHRLSDSTVSHPEIVDTKFERSVLGIESVERRLVRQENRYLDEKGRESLDLTSLPRDQTKQLETRRRLQDNRIVVLRGAIGTGKTTTAYHTLAALERTGAFVGVANFENSEYTYIRHALELVDDRPRYLFVSYRLGFPAIDTPRQLRNLIKLVDDGLCERIIIECRDEVHQDLLNRGGDAVQGHQGLPSIWQSREIVECRTIDGETVEGVVSWVYSQYNVDANDDVLSTDRLVEKFGRNPEFIKIAARLSAEGASVDDVETIGELIELDIQSLLSNFEEGKEKYREFIELLTLTRSLSVERAMTILGESLRRSDIVKLEEALRGYVKFPEDEIQTTPSMLVPDIYTDLLFQYWYVDENPPRLLLAQVQDILDVGYDELVPDVLLNLSLTYARSDVDSKRREKCHKAATKSLVYLDEVRASDSYLQAVTNLGSIPLRADAIAWNRLEQSLDKDFMENMWEYRVYSEMVVGPVLNEEYDETLDLTVSIGRLMASQLRTYDANEAEQTYAKAGELLFRSGESHRWSEEVMANLPADLLTYMLMESTRITVQQADETKLGTAVKPMFRFFDELNHSQTVHAEAASRLFAAPFVEASDAVRTDVLLTRLKQLFDEVSPYLHDVAERSDLFEPKERSDWSSPSSVFLRRFHLEVALLTGLETDSERFEEWARKLWKSVEETIGYCEQPANSLFATARTILLGAAVRQEMVLGKESDLLSTSFQTMVKEITPRQIPPSELLLSQWFTEHPDSWYARLLELLVANVVGQHHNESFGDNLMYKIAGNEEPNQTDLLGIVEAITTQVKTARSDVNYPSRFKYEVCYAWYRALVLSGPPTQLEPYLKQVDQTASQVLTDEARKYLRLWAVLTDELQNTAGGAVDPYRQLSEEKLMSETMTSLLPWLEVFLDESDSLLAASRFSKEQVDNPAGEIETVLSKIIGLLAAASSKSADSLEKTPENPLEVIFMKSEPVLQNVEMFVKESELFSELPPDMRMGLKYASTT